MLRSVLLCGLFFLTSCIKDEYEGPDPNLPSRTVLFWLGGDNTLSGETTQKIESLRQGWTWTGSKCLIYVDTPDGARLLRIRGGCSVTPTPYVETVREYGEENSASGATFSRVLGEVTSEYPADDYGLVYFSHASGWLPAGTLQRPGRLSASAGASSGLSSAPAGSCGRSLGWDDGTPQNGQDHAEMELSDFAAAIPDHQFSFIVFESCLMAGVEVAYELRNKTDYLLASSAEMLSPGYAPVYPSASHYLFDTRLTVESSLREFAGSYFSYMDSQVGWRRSATQSIIRTSGLEALSALVGEVFGDSTHSISSGAIAGLQHFDRPGSYGDSPAVARYFDFAEYMETIATPEQYASLTAQLDRVVVWTGATEDFLPDQNGFRIARHSGLTVYVPQGVFPALDEAYTHTSWYRAVR